MTSLPTPPDPQLAVVVPCHDAAPFLRQMAQSVLAQTMPLELILVDDASSDETLAIARALAAEDARVKVVSMAENRGAFAARRIGVAHATAPYVHFLDADDEGCAEVYPLALERLRQSHADVLHGTGAYVPEAGFQPSQAILDEFRQDKFGPHAPELLGQDIFRAPHAGRLWFGLLWNKIISRALLEKALAIFPEDFQRAKRGNDIPLVYALYFFARHFLPAPDLVLCRYHVGRGETQPGAAPWVESRFLGRFSCVPVFDLLAQVDASRQPDIAEARATFLANCAEAIAPRLADLPEAARAQMHQKVLAVAPADFPPILQRVALAVLGKTRASLQRHREGLAQTREKLAKNREALAKHREALAKHREALAQTRTALADSRKSLAQTRMTLARTQKSLQTLRRSRRYRLACRLAALFHLFRR
ncbi:MAG: glycosyltransferase [Kiritimatiellae bacterium]|nr:glycosyltransferase [Kiritimatiellia bacterium]